MATHEFQEGLKNYRDLTYLYRNLDTWQQNVDVYANMIETRRLKFEQSLEYVEDALAVVDPGELIGLKVGYDAIIDNIEGGRDWLSLAEKSEFDRWREITDLELTPALQADIPEAAEVRDKIDLLKGVMQWNLERDFRGRVTAVRQDLQETGEALVATQRSWRQIQDTMYSEPLRLAELSDQVYGLTPHIEELKTRVSGTLGRQQAFLQEIAVGELQAQKDRLDVYTIQARFALAAIYDVASTVGESGE